MAISPALLALDATVAVQGGFGARDVPIEEFLQARDRRSGTLVLSVSCTRPASTEAFRYRKVARIKPKGGSGHHARGASADLRRPDRRARGLHWARWRRPRSGARAAERALEGRSLDAETIAAAASAATEGTSPSDNALGSAWYRREIVGVHLRRLLSGQE